jgi:hypothetical protein
MNVFLLISAGIACHLHDKSRASFNRLEVTEGNKCAQIGMWRYRYGYFECFI